MCYPWFQLENYSGHTPIEITKMVRLNLSSFGVYSDYSVKSSMFTESSLTQSNNITDITNKAFTTQPICLYLLGGKLACCYQKPF